MSDAPGTATTGWSEQSAGEWVRGDEGDTRFVFPWKLTAEIARQDDEITHVLDVASGPGGYLNSVLNEIPRASGVWFDFSETMQEAARVNLAAFGDRVQFIRGDITDLSAAGDRESFDMVTSSRATHHLTITDLEKFYASAADRLRSGGWIANLDNFNPGPMWRPLLQQLSRVQEGRPPGGSGSGSHPHPNAVPRIGDHIKCMYAAGFGQPALVWKMLSSGLLMARKL